MGTRYCRTLFALICIAVLDYGSLAAGQMLPREISIHTYYSPSGEYSITTDPNDRYGYSGSVITVRHRDSVVWTRKCGTTFLMAGITDNGVAVGCGDASITSSNKANPVDYLHVIILDEHGKVLLDDSVKKRFGGYADGPDMPIPNAIILDPDNDRFIVRVADTDLNQGFEAWWVYKLSAAHHTATIVPKSFMAGSENASFLIDARPVRGTPLMLVHWWYSDTKPGARFTLVGLDGRPVWTMTLPADYQLPDEKAQDQLMDEIRANGAILHEGGLGRFAIRFAAAKQQVDFSVALAPTGGWKVTEVGRTPYIAKLSPAEASTPIVPIRKLKALGQVQFPPEYSPNSSAVRDLYDFVPAGANRIGFIRREPTGADSLIVVTTKGKLVHQTRLTHIPIIQGYSWSGYVWVGDDRFLVTRSSSESPSGASAWYVDARTGAVTLVAGFICPPITRLAAFPSGGFIALTQSSSKYAMSEELRAYSAHGRLKWCVGGDAGYNNNDQPGKLFSPEDVTVDMYGNVIVLDNIAHTLQLYDRRGTFKRKLFLDRALKRELEYPTRVVCDSSGFLVYDYPAKAAILRFSRRGALRSATKLAKKASGLYGVLEGIAFDSDHRLWVSDRHNLTRISHSGAIDRTLGVPPASQNVGHIDDLQMTSDGRICALDCRAGVVHIFDSSGKRLTTEPAGFQLSQDPGSSASVHPLESGEICVWNDHKCRMLAAARPPTHSAQPDRTAKKKAQLTTFWATEFESAVLVDVSGRTLATVDRYPDRTWMQFILSGSSSPGGTLAILSRRPFDSVTRVSLYSPSGAPLDSFVATAPKDSYSVAFDGNRVAVCGSDGVVCYSATGKPLWRFLPESGIEEGQSWQVYLTAGELRLFDPAKRVVYRFEMPTT